MRARFYARSGRLTHTRVKSNPRVGAEMVPSRPPAFQQAVHEAESDALAALQRRVVGLRRPVGDVLKEAVSPEEEGVIPAVRHRLHRTRTISGK